MTATVPRVQPAGTRWLTALVVGVLFATAAALLVLTLPVSVRHAAPFGSSQTVDFDRSIATLGGEVRSNYPGFDRVRLDLRSYSASVPGGQYDFVLTIQDVNDGEIVRRVAFSVPSVDIPATKSAFSGLGTPVTFDPIPDSAGKPYYVSLERGPRNAIDVVTLWGIQSYSTLTPLDVLQAAADDYDIGFSAWVNRSIMLVLLWLTLVAGSVCVGAVVTGVWPERPARPA